MKRKPLKIYAGTSRRFGPVRIIRHISYRTTTSVLETAGRELADRLYTATPSTFYDGVLERLREQSPNEDEARVAVLEKANAEQRESLNKLGALCTAHERQRDAAQAEAAKLRLELAQRRDQTSLNRALNDMSANNAGLAEKLRAALTRIDELVVQVHESKEALRRTGAGWSNDFNKACKERDDARSERDEYRDELRSQNTRMNEVRVVLGTKPSETVLESAQRVVNHRNAEQKAAWSAEAAFGVLKDRAERAEKSVANWERKYDRIRTLLDQWNAFPESKYSLRQLVAYRMAQGESYRRSAARSNLDYVTAGLRAGEAAAEVEGNTREAE